MEEDHSNSNADPRSDSRWRLMPALLAACLVFAPLAILWTYFRIHLEIRRYEQNPLCWVLLPPVQTQWANALSAPQCVLPFLASTCVLLIFHARCVKNRRSSLQLQMLFLFLWVLYALFILLFARMPDVLYAN